jgi:hypothetical protein
MDTFLKPLGPSEHALKLPYDQCGPTANGRQRYLERSMTLVQANHYQNGVVRWYQIAPNAIVSDPTTATPSASALYAAV